MKALILDAPTTLRPGDWPDPSVGPHDVLLRPRAVGVCAGDLYAYSGRHPYSKYPLICGHEICGEIVAVGRDVRGLQPGQRAVVEPVVGCGTCHPCRHGKPNCCMIFSLIGLQRPGGFAELCAAPARNVHLVPDRLDAVTASFAEPLTIALHACRRGSVSAGDLCVVLGAGPIGLAVAEVALLRGARVIVADVNAGRLAFARELGVETLLSDERLLATIRDLTDGAGAEVVVEATGVPAVMAAALDLVAPGERLVILGLGKTGSTVAFPGLDLTRKEVNILGSRNSVNCFPEAVALLASGALRYPRVAVQFSLWDAPQLFARLHAEPGTLHKAVLTLG